LVLTVLAFGFLELSFSLFISNFLSMSIYILLFNGIKSQYIPELFDSTQFRIELFANWSWERNLGIFSGIPMCNTREHYFPADRQFCLESGPGVKELG
jgi:hypothetical protein